MTGRADTDHYLCRNQTYLGHEALRQAHLPIREGGLGLISSDAIKGAAYIACQALVLGHVVAASTWENLPSLLERLPDRPMASAFIDELKTFATDVGRCDMEDVGDTSWTALTAGENPHARGLGALLVEVDALRREGRRDQGQGRRGEG